MPEFATQIVDLLNGLIWGKILIWMLVGCGLLFTFRLASSSSATSAMRSASSRAAARAMTRVSRRSRRCARHSPRGWAPATVAGVAVAITLGGPGAVFWMWVIALVGMATGFVEAALAQLFKIRDDRGQYRGGPAYYMEKGLGARWMGSLFSVFLILAFGFVFNSVQANTITGAMQGAFGVPAWLCGVGIVLLTAPIIFGGLRSIARFSQLAVPFMAAATCSLRWRSS